MVRHQPKHAAPTPARSRRSTGLSIGRHQVRRFAVPLVVLAGLSGATAVAWPTAQPAEVAVPAPISSSAQPAGRSSADEVSRSQQRPTVEQAKTASAWAKAKAADQALAKKHHLAEKSAAKKAAAQAPDGAVRSLQIVPVKSLDPGQRWATITVNLRSQADESARTAVDLDAGEPVTITGYTAGIWAEVRVDGGKRWVKTAYLRKSEPSTGSDTKASDSSGSGGSGSTGSSTSGGSLSSTPCPSGSSVESGLTPDAIKVHRALCRAFPAISAYGGVRPDSLPEHPSGRALDAMIGSSGQGQAIADWARAHASELGISEVIYAQRIWTVQRSSEGWRSMSDRGSASANHYDHVHVTVYGSSAR